jgi:hypothetical protein
MDPVRRLAAELRRAHDGDPWHGASTVRLLEGVTAEQAALRPIPGAHTIAEIVRHMTAWTHEVHRRLHGDVPGIPSEGDWPGAAPESPGAAWEAAKEALGAARLALIADLERFPASHLDDQVGRCREAPLGTGYSFEVMLDGLAQHDAYHSGQISLLRKALAALEPSRSPGGAAR